MDSDPGLDANDLGLYIINIFRSPGCDDPILTDPSSLDAFILNPNSESLFLVESPKNHISISQSISDIDNDLAISDIIVLIKPKGELTKDRPLGSQLMYLNLPLNSLAQNQVLNVDLVDRLRSLVQFGLNPCFDILHANGAQSTLTAARKKLGEFAISLQNMDDQIQVPNLLEQTHPRIALLVNGTETATLDALVADSSLLNELTRIALAWIRQIQAITRLAPIPSATDSISARVLFWKSMEIALTSIAQQVSRPEISMSLEILNKAKRFHVTLAFQNDLGIKEITLQARNFNTLLKDLPITELTTCPDADLNAFATAASNLFEHLKQKLNSNVSIGPHHAVEIVNLTLLDVTHKFCSVLSAIPIMSLEPSAFFELHNSITLLGLNRISLHIKFISNLLRDLNRKRSDRSAGVAKIDMEKFLELRTAVDHIRELFQGHYDLLQIARLFLVDNAAWSELSTAYSRLLIPICPFDFSAEGKAVWCANEKEYQLSHMIVRKRVQQRLSQLLETVALADFSAAFRQLDSFGESQRTRWLQLISDNQRTQILKAAGKEVHNLISINRAFESEKFNFHSSIPLDYFMDSVTSRIAWSLSVNRKLSFYAATLTDLLGDNWSQYSSAKILEADMRALSQANDAEKLFRSWIEQAETQMSEITQCENVFVFLEVKDEVWDFDISYGQASLLLIDQAQTLANLGLKIPTNLFMQLKRIEKINLVALDLCETIGLLKAVFDSEATDLGLRSLSFFLLPSKRKIKNLLAECHDVKWKLLADTLELMDVVERQGSSLGPENGFLHKDALNLVNAFQFEVRRLYQLSHEVIRLEEIIITACHELQTCSFDSSSILNTITTMNESFKKVDLDDAVDNAPSLFYLVHLKLTQILEKRCEDRLSRFKSYLVSTEPVNEFDTFKPLFSAIIIQGQSVLVTNPLSLARTWSLDFVNTILQIYELQTHVCIFGHSVELCAISESLEEYLVDVLRTIDEIVDEASRYFSFWRSLITLWNVDVSSDAGLKQLLPETANLECWFRLVAQVSHLQDYVGGHNSEKKFGSLLAVSHASIQAHASHCLKLFRGELLKIFSDKLCQEITSLTLQLDKPGSSLEYQLNFHGRPRAIITQLLEVIDINDRVKVWDAQILTMKNCQNFLFKSLFQIPAEWRYVESLENKFSNIEAYLTKKNEEIEANMAFVLSIVQGEAEKLNKECACKVAEWQQKKPIESSNDAENALLILQVFSKHLSHLARESSDLARISVEWRLDISIDANIDSIKEELESLRSVWGTIHQLWAGIQEVQAKKWSDTTSKLIRADLERLNGSTKLVPSNIRLHDAFVKIQISLDRYIEKQPFINIMKSRSFESRHWTSLLAEVGRNDIDPKKLTVGDVLSIEFSTHESSLKKIVQQADAEKTISEELCRIESEWSLTHFEFFAYKDQCRLVKNWALLFERCNNDLGVLSSIRNNPYHVYFEFEITNIESKVSKLFSLLDVWIDVQRQWIYLDGIFANGIQSVLPVEAARFVNITHEYMDIIKILNNSTLVIEVLSVAQAHASMTKLRDSITRIRKSLSDYLEKQREFFPRFYFVGNEDLLEVLSDLTNTLNVNRHMKKMFCGIEAVECDLENTAVISIRSAQEEVVSLVKPVPLIKAAPPAAWLQALEGEVKNTLAHLTVQAVTSMSTMIQNEETTSLEGLKLYCTQFPTQVCVLALQIVLTRSFEKFHDREPNLDSILKEMLIALSRLVGIAEGLLQRTAFEHMIIELVHQNELLLELKKQAAVSKTHQESYWFMQQKFYLTNSADACGCVKVQQADSSFMYGFEYLGVPDKLVYTPLIDRCFLAMTQALSQGKGGSPFGPAGTGKTESVKALGQNLGRMVVVFCCDESFDYKSIGRLLLGLCKVGCWGCFDEFNRLDEKSLSSVSSLIEDVELALSRPGGDAIIAGKPVKMDPQTGIFVTMNPGYAGRTELPDSLRKQFRSFAMTSPDSIQIIEVLLTSCTFEHARDISIVLHPFFIALEEKVSPQPHYNFGLRSLKSVLVSCGVMKRKLYNNSSIGILEELKCVLLCIVETLLPRLVKQDESVLRGLIQQYFPNVSVTSNVHDAFCKALKECCARKSLVLTDEWRRKAIQINQAQKSHHGVMIVGRAGCGKSSIWSLVLESLGNLEEKDVISYVIDCKVSTKEDIYGSLDEFTRDWTDGVFTSILRKVRANLRAEQSKIVWIVFDGDVDPDWIENLNSILDDNRILTLPNGERLALTPNIRLIFETDSLQYATQATVSRCAMVWVDEDIVLGHQHFEHCVKQWSHLLGDLRSSVMRDAVSYFDDFVSHVLLTLDSKALAQIWSEAKSISHIMKQSLRRSISTLSALLYSYCGRYFGTVLQVLPNDLRKYAMKACLMSTIWAFSGDSALVDRQSFEARILKLECFAQIDEVAPGTFHLDYDISIPDAEWLDWSRSVNHFELDPHQLEMPNIVVPTIDTVRHERLIYSLLNEHQPLILCGPPGSGKTMTLLESIRLSAKFDLISLNFSKESTPQALMKSLDQFCEFRKTSTGLELVPRVSSKWVIVFCDEINLPQADSYGTQKVISLIRQMVEQKGFWSTGKNEWVKLRNIQFVGACNPPTDPGRHPLSDRFLRHATLIMVDYPGEPSLKKIYHTFNYAALKYAPDLRGYATTTTDAMLSVYTKTSQNITSALQDHYIYSPRELTRWVKGISECLKQSNVTELLSFVKVWFHEGMRLFHDRLTGDWERSWTSALFEATAKEYFPVVDRAEIFSEPIFFSKWLSASYEPVRKEDLRRFVAERMRTFADEEAEVELVLHQGVLDHCLRIDRVLRNPQGHMILVGPCTSGKTTITKFVAWINGLSVVQLSVYRNFSIDDFDATLRHILMRCAGGERICFVIDESSILETTFVERMNTLLANAEIPGLFDDEEHAALMKLCVSESRAQGLLLDTDDELYLWFTQRISANLHVVINVSQLLAKGLQPAVISSPALFNRCVLNWMGDWSDATLHDIGNALIRSVPLDVSTFEIPDTFEPCAGVEVSGFRDAVIDAFVFFHRKPVDSESLISWGNVPRDFVSSVELFSKIFAQKLTEMESDHKHTMNGLDKLREAVIEVNSLKSELSHMQSILAVKNKEARIMLNKMLSDQNEAERKQEFSLETQKELERQEQEIKARRNLVIRDLKLAEPAVLEAQRRVQNIKKQHLTEIRSMSNPPAAVKLAMESVCRLLGHNVSSWRDVQGIVRRDDFIANIVSFRNEEQVTSELRSVMEKQYLSREDYTYEAVDRASKACGPLLEWVVAQLQYAKILKDVDPLRAEVEALETHAHKTKAQLIAIDQMITELESSIEKYKDDYSELIREVEKIKQETVEGQEKIAKSTFLIESLTSEKDRWRENVQRFAKQREQLVGNAILASAFVTFAGAYDNKGRQLLTNLWTSRLAASGIKFEPLLSVSKMILQSLGEDVIKSLSDIKDEIERQNLAMISFCEFPMVIDPSSRALELVPLLFESRNVIVTSFLAEGYIKVIENALKFGGTVLIADAEHYDPILDHVLRGDIHRNGGRKIVRLGKVEVDYDPSFKLVMCSKDANLCLSPFVESRVNYVNFTVTSGSLEEKVLDVALHEKHPDIESKREKLMMLQGEYRDGMVRLERQLLLYLSDAEGHIIENKSILSTLEALKSDSKAMDSKMRDSEVVLMELDNVRDEFRDLGTHAAAIYKVLTRLKSTNSFYDFALQDYITLLKNVLGRIKSDKALDYILPLYKETYAASWPMLFNGDRLFFALLLSICYYDGQVGSHCTAAAKRTLELLALGNNATHESILDICLARYDPEQEQSFETLILINPDNEAFITIAPLYESLITGSKDLYGAIRAFTAVLQPDDKCQEYDFKHLMQRPKANVSPILFISHGGCDATSLVERLAAEKRCELITVSMGSKESLLVANKNISIALSRGSWLLVQNVELAPSWLNLLEQKLSDLKHAEGFRLLLTCKQSFGLMPSTLLQTCRVISYETPPGLRNTMLETFAFVPREELEEANQIFCHVYLLIVFFYSVLLERLRFVPLSFENHYDIDDSDFTAGYKALRNVCGNHPSQESINWQKLVHLVGTITFGSKVSSRKDLEYIELLAEHLFRPQSLRGKFDLVMGSDADEDTLDLELKEAATVDYYREWIEALPESTPLACIGLANKAADELDARNSHDVVKKVVQTLKNT